MAQRSLYDLTLNISANSAELKKELDNANKKLDGFHKNAKDIGNKITSALSFVGVGLSITAVFKTVEKVLNSTQFTADALQVKIAGIKEVANTVAQNLASLDFSVSLKDAKKAAEELTKVLDDLADRKRSVDIISAKNYSEVVKLRGQLRDTTISEEKRLEVSKRIQEIGQEELDLKKQIAEEALGGMISKSQIKYKIDLESAKLIQSYVEDYARFDRSQQDALNNAMAAQQKLDTYLTNNSENIKKGLYRTKTMEKYQLAVAEATKLVTPELQKYIKLWRPINDLSDEQRDEIKAIVVEWYNANSAIQTYLNTAERTERKLQDVGEEVVKISRATPIAPVSTSNLTMPTFTPTLDTTSLAPSNNPGSKPPTKVLEDWQEFTDRLNEIIASGLQNVVQTMSEGFGALIIEGKGALPKLATSLLGAFANILDQLSAIAFGVALGIKAIKTALKSLNPAVALAAGIALAALSGLVKAGIAKIADKSSSVSSGSNQPSFGNFADGGVVYGETIARVAEYSGARTNPEVIAPLDKLKNLLGNAGGLVEFQIKDDILYGILDRRNRRVSSYA